MRGLFLAAAALAAATLAACAAPNDAEPAVPGTPAGKQLSGYLQAAQGGPEKVRAFLQKELAPALLEPQRLGRHAAFANDAAEEGGLRLVRVDAKSEHELEALLHFRLTETGLLAMLRVEPEPPHRIAAISIRQTDLPGEGKARGPEEVGRELDAYLKRLGEADRFSGAVLVAKDGEPFYTKAVGLASRAWNAPNRVDTKFNLGSMNKMFTAVAIGQLVQAGKVAFTDPVGKHLPAFPNKDVREKVTLHHLLTHTSGLGDYFNDEFLKTSRDQFRTVNDYLPLFQEKPLVFEPGARFQYSNAGFMLLGAVIEKVTGQDYFEYVREHIYRPAGMKDTDAYELDREIPNLATGYTRMSFTGPLPKGETRNNLFLHVIRGGPAGGGYSTVEDLLRFARALHSGKLLEGKVRDQLLEGKVDAPMGRYAYGFILTGTGSGFHFGHSGGFPGISSTLEIYPETGHVVAVLSNSDQGAPVVAAKVRRLVGAAG